MRQRLSKTKRHAKVLEIIRGKPIETQEDLAASLQEEGFEVTQATVSRDIKELGITKTCLLYTSCLPNAGCHPWVFPKLL